jgi:hypothetical protein
MANVVKMCLITNETDSATFIDKVIARMMVNIGDLQLNIDSKT